MRFPKVHLRDLFWLVLVAACLCGWWYDQARITKRLNEVDELREEMEEKKADLQGVLDRVERGLDRTVYPKPYSLPVPDWEMPVVPDEPTKESDESI
jgi:hypothetical protein